MRFVIPEEKSDVVGNDFKRLTIVNPSGQGLNQSKNDFFQRRGQMGASDWIQDRTKFSGPPAREVRFNLAARAFAESQLRNRMPPDGGAGCPIVVEGKRDKEALRALGFEGPIELINRGWDRSRLIAYFYDTYGTRNTIDGGPPLMLLMDWDRTGGRIQTTLRDRLNSLDVPIDENLRKVLLRTMKPEGKTVEALAPFAKTLRPLIEEQFDRI